MQLSLILWPTELTCPRTSTLSLSRSESRIETEVDDTCAELRPKPVSCSWGVDLEDDPGIRGGPSLATGSGAS